MSGPIHLPPSDPSLPPIGQQPATKKPTAPEHEVDQKIQQQAKIHLSDVSIEAPSESRIIQMQRHLRKRMALRKIKEERSLTPTERLEKAERVSQVLNESNKDLIRSGRCVRVDSYTREPIENVVRLAEADKDPKLPSRPFSRFISADRFTSALRSSFEDTLSTVLSLPADQQAYVIIGDGIGKSTNWVTAQVLDTMAVHPPQAIVLKRSLQDYLKDHPEIKTVVMLDDGIYSGNQAINYIVGTKDALQGKNFCLCIPYMTLPGEKRIKKLLNYIRVDSIAVASHQEMMTYQQLIKAGFLPGAENSSEELYNDYNGEKFKNKTGTWMAHKSADTLSTDYERLLQVTGRETIPPYKEDLYSDSDKITSSRKERIKELQQQSPEFPKECQRLMGERKGFNSIIGVKTNRGCFLLSDRYFGSGEAKESMTLVVNGKTFPFGGSEGLYQWKLEEGDDLQFLSNSGENLCVSFKNGRIIDLTI